MHYYNFSSERTETVSKWILINLEIELRYNKNFISLKNEDRYLHDMTLNNI